MKVCSQCGSPRVEISLPAWFDANTHEQTGTDDEADAMYTYCHDCDEARSGNWTDDADIEGPDPIEEPDVFGDWLAEWPGEEK